MSNDVVQITDETKNKLKELDKPEFDEQEAYFLLCEIFAHAQATKDYAKFQSDLSEWKKRFPIELFSDAYKTKIKYMLSKEFLDTVLKNFIAFDELSKKDPAQGLEKLRKILNKAEKHKDAKQLDKDLDSLYAEYPLKYLKEKYPHVVSHLLSKSNRTRILEKFDSSLAFKELSNITQKPQNYTDVNDFKADIEEWQKLYPTADFNDKFRPEVEKLLTETLDTRNLEKLFPVPTELDLSEGEVIPLELKEHVENISLISKDALHDFFKIVDKNKGDIDSLFDWTCKYNKYINSFDSTIKATIVDNLMTKYAYELPPLGTKFEIPKMDAGTNDLLSLEDFQNMEDTKKQVVLQLLGILSTGKELTHEDNYRLEIIGSNAKKIEIIEKAKIEPKLNLFIEKFPEDKLTPSDNIYLDLRTNNEIDITIEKNALSEHSTETNDTEIETENSSFIDTIKIIEPLEKVDTNSSNNSTTDGGSSGGTGLSISSNNVEVTKNDLDDLPNEDKESEENVSDTFEKTIITPESTIQAVVLESNDNTHEMEDLSNITIDNEEIIEESTINKDTTETSNDITRENPVQNFFRRFLGREKFNSRDDERDER